MEWSAYAGLIKTREVRVEIFGLGGYTSATPVKAIVLDGPELDAYGQMALDEALVDSAKPDTVALRFYRWPEGSYGSVWGKPLYAVTFGYFQKYEAVLQEASQVRAPLPPLVRRLTGGGIVYHDGDITFSLIFPWSRPRSPSAIYRDIHWGIHAGLKARALPSRLWSPPDRKTDAAEVCFAEPAPFDLVHEDGKKFLGGALRRSRGTGLYQGSMRPERLGAAGEGRLSLPQAGVSAWDRETLEEAIVEGMGLEWKVLFRRGTPPSDLLKDARRLRLERYCTDEWNKRR